MSTEAQNCKGCGVVISEGAALMDGPVTEYAGMPVYTYEPREVTLDEALDVLKDIARFAHHRPNPEGHYCDCACCKARKLLGVPASVDLYVP